jgi:2,5-diketo-D-gluconate reductase A
MRHRRMGTSGLSVSSLALGTMTWGRSTDFETASDQLRAFLSAGGTLVDTAHGYSDGAAEEFLGRIIDEELDRDDVLICTKAGISRRSGKRVVDTSRFSLLSQLDTSLERLGTDHVDLWLVHWPAGGDADLRLWRAFVEAREAGLARDIGVSNFDASLIDSVVEATGVVPAVDQVKWSPLLYDPSVVADHRSRRVVLEGYSGLRGGTLDHPVIAEVAGQVGRTTAQVVVRWHLQHGIVVIPKSSHPDRVRSNADVAGFELSAEQMCRLDGLGRS